MPLSRATSRPTTSATRLAHATPATTPSQIGKPDLVVRIAEPYAPTAMKPTDASENTPAWKTMNTLITSRVEISVMSMKNWCAWIHSSTGHRLLAEEPRRAGQQPKPHPQVREGVVEARRRVGRDQHLADSEQQAAGHRSGD